MTAMQLNHQIKTAILCDDERNRLVRLCTRLVGDAAAAEDLAQETLLTAWYRCDQVTKPEGLSHWLAAIARNHCRHWIRSQSRRSNYVVTSDDLDTAMAGDSWIAADAFDLDAELDREQISHLLDRALGYLPAESQSLLVHHYIEAIPQAELAAQIGIKPSAVAGRLRRGKTALRRLLVTEFSDEALALGLIATERVGWQTTHIWCPHCGAKRLCGKFANDDSGHLILRCDCGANFGFNGPSDLLTGVRGYQPALKRVKKWTHTFLQTGLRRGEVDCPHCTRTIKLHLTARTPIPESMGLGPADEQIIWAYCPTCEWATFCDLESLASSFPAANDFWLTHRRIKALPLRRIEYNEAPASVIHFQSLANSAANLVLIFHASTFDLLDIAHHPL